MKKVILLFVFSVVATMAWAQEYQMHIKARLKYDNNNVRCDSWFTIKAHTITGEVFEWYENIDLGEGDWGEYEHTFTFPASQRVDRLDIHAKRETSDCKTRDEGDQVMTISSAWYPCYNVTRTALFRGYSGESTVEVTIAPLSLSKFKILSFTFNQYALQAEAQVECINSVANFRYGIWVVYENGDELEIIRRNRSLGDGEKVKTQGALITTRSLVDRFEVRVSYGIFGTQTLIKPYEVTDDGSDINIDWTDADDPVIPFMSPNSRLKIRYSQPKTPLAYSLGTGNILPSANKIRLTIPESNNDPFQWQYSLDGGATFSNAPAAFGTRNVVTFSGEDLFGSTWKDHIFQNVTVKALYTCATGRETQIITLVHLPSAPDIVKVEPEMETCYGYRDGKIKITFKRALYDNEKLYVFIDDESFETESADFDSDHATTLLNFKPGTYNISLLTTFGSLGNGYSDGAGHKSSTSIPERTAITGFDAVVANVHCHAGEDGKLTVSATGGTGEYNAYLEQDGEQLQHITLTYNTSNAFTDLAQGTYVVKLKDSKGCDPKEDNGDIRQPSYTITEPEEKVLLSTVRAEEPLGFGLKNGYIVVRTVSGTSPYTFAWTDDDLKPLTAEPPVPDGSTILDSLKHIGKGVYHVRAQDSNYALALPQTETNVRGCYDTLTIELDEPPLLEVSVAEKHYVSCFNYKDGKIVARGTGGRPYLTNHPNPYDYAWYEVLEDNNTVKLVDIDSIAVDRHSSRYQVMITDRNGIQAWSNPFELVQPDSLEIVFTTSKLLCNGDHNGTSHAQVTGGTRDYFYAWSNEATLPDIDQLEEGVYSLVVRDTRGCITLGQTEVEVPDGLEVDSVVVFPTCQGYKDGAIQVKVQGGQEPYEYAWSNNADAALVNNLGAGTYHVRVTDDNDCFVLRDYTLKDPELFGIDLGPDRVLCKDQTLDLNVGLADASAQYNWTRDGVAFAATPAVQLTESGNYAVAITDSKGCGNQDAVKITRDDLEISASIIVASRAPQAEKIRVANISFPSSDRVEWILPEEANVIEETPDYIDISFTSKGAYDIGMISYRGSCEKTTYSQVHVVDKRELTDYVIPDAPYIQQFIVTPNPNDGRFAATVELREDGDFAMLLHNAQGEVIDRRDVKGQSFARIEFDVSSAVSKGVYVLQLVTAQGYATFKVIIQ